MDFGSSQAASLRQFQAEISLDNQLRRHVVMVRTTNDPALNVKCPFLRRSEGNCGGFPGLYRLFYAERRNVKAVLDVGRSDVQLHRLTGFHPDFGGSNGVLLHYNVDVFGRGALVLASQGHANET